METRSRKRAEATARSQSPAPRSKKPRLSASASPSSIPPRPRSSRSSSANPTAATAAAFVTGRFKDFVMDSATDSVATGSRSENTDLSSSKFSKREHDKDEDIGSEKMSRAFERDKEGERGKEREIERGRSGRVDLDRSTSAGVSGAGDDDVDGDGVSTLQQNFASASSALHGLLRKLGAGLDDLLPSSNPSSHQSSRLKRILSGLRAEGEEARQLESLSQLCELLSIGTEDSLSSFSVESFVPVLVGLLNHESHADMMLLAARALTHLCDVLPSSCAAVVHYGAVPSFCARLLAIEYIDLAEQSLQALEKISHEHPAACLRAGALIAVLSYLDFFPTGVQRVAVSTAANICRQLPEDAADFVMEAVPILTNLLQYSDFKVVEHASVCLTRIAEAFAKFPDKIDKLCSHGLISQTVRLISVSSSSGSLGPQASLSTSTYTGLIRLLSICASGSAAAAESLLLLNISTVIKDILAGAGLISSTSVSSSSINRPSDQLYEIVSLVNELLPPIPETKVSIFPANNQSRDGVIREDVSPREKLLREQPQVLLQFGTNLFPVLVQVYGSSVNSPVRSKCLAAIHKLLHFSTAEMLSILLKETNIASFLAGVLASKDPSVLMTALQISELLMQKLPNTFFKMLVKEGVVHAIDMLIASDVAATSAATSSSTGKSEDMSSNSNVGVQPSKPRRGLSGRRRSSGHSNDTGIEDPGGAYSLPAGSFPPATSSEPAINAGRSGLLATAIGAARKFKETYFSENSGFSDGGVTESMCKLKALCSKLNGELTVEVKGKGKGKNKATSTSALGEEQMFAVVQEILTEIGTGDGVSTFEFVGSGVMMAFLNYFSCGRSTRDDTDSTSATQRQQALKRFKQFIGLSLPVSAEQNKDLPLALLVRKLQNALSSLERFPVVLSHGPRSSGGSASLAAGLSALTQPFKLRLCRAAGEKTLRDYSSNVVLIEPLATLAAVEEFLWSRVRRQDGSPTSTAQASTSDAVASACVAAAATSTSTSTPPSDSRPSTRSRSSMFTPPSAGGSREIGGGAPSSSKGKGKMASKSSNEAHNHFEHRGPETRNAAARRRAAAAGTSSFDQSQAGVGGVLENEEIELDVSPVEIEEAVAMEEDELSEEGDDDDDDHEEVFGEEPAEVCIGERVHDVRLGDAVEVGAVASTSAATSETPTQPSLFCAGLAGVNLGGRTSVLISGAEASGSRTGGTVGSRGALSFAAAAMAGVASASANSVRAGRDRRSLAAITALNAPARLVFYLNGRQLNRSLTIFQAIQRQAVTDENDEERYTGPDQQLGGGRRLWDEVYTITYQRVDPSPEKTGVSSTIENKKPGITSESRVTTVGTGKPVTESSWQQASLLDGILQGELPCDLDKSNSTYHILLLLRALEALNRLAPRLRDQIASDAFVEGKITSLSQMKIVGPLVAQEEFLSSKLTPKLARQMQDALALCSGGLPAWCHQLTRSCPFLFPFETRRQYFYSTAFGLSRALQRLQQQQSADGPAPSNERELRVGRLQRQKVRVSRNQILDSATKVMEMYCGHKAVLEVEYFGEVGTGLGPTLEFYTLLSHDLQKKSLLLWRSDSDHPNTGSFSRDTEMHDAEIEAMDDSSTMNLESSIVQPSEITVEYVHAPRGLFPRPWHLNADRSSSDRYAKVIEHFRLLGRTVAKALQDGRLLDLPLSVAFYKLVLGQELDLYDIKSIDFELGSTLQELQLLVRQKRYSDAASQSTNNLLFRNSRVEDLCLDFTLPGYPEYELMQNGSNIMVTLKNLEEYVSLVVDATLKTGIAAQMEAFRAGFNQVFPLSSLQIFNEEELGYLLCGRRELWVPETLADNIKFDHGYTAASHPIRHLLEILGELNAEQQRAFLRFVTGAPRLPPGGLASLNPKLTIVRKHPTGTGGTNNVLGTTPPGAVSALGTTLADGDLPSVMTCANYLKLPPYSCKEVMRERLLYAISEGQGSFDLS